MTMNTAKILKRAFGSDDQRVVEELVKDVKFKYLGTSSVDLFIHTSKTYASKKIESNLLPIKDAIYEIDEKTVRDVFINNIKVEVEINELSTKHNIGLIDLSSIEDEKTNEMSGENNIVDQLFEYESSVLQKNKVLIHLHQKEMNKEWKEEVSMSIVKSRFSRKKKHLSKRLKELISLKYQPNNNDTKEIIELLRLK